MVLLMVSANLPKCPTDRLRKAKRLEAKKDFLNDDFFLLNIVLREAKQIISNTMTILCA